MLNFIQLAARYLDSNIAGLVMYFVALGSACGDVSPSWVLPFPRKISVFRGRSSDNSDKINKHVEDLKYSVSLPKYLG